MQQEVLRQVPVPQVQTVERVVQAAPMAAPAMTYAAPTYTAPMTTSIAAPAVATLTTPFSAGTTAFGYGAGSALGVAGYGAGPALGVAGYGAGLGVAGLWGDTAGHMVVCNTQPQKLRQSRCRLIVIQPGLMARCVGSSNGLVTNRFCSCSHRL